ncbi:MAG: HAMP domain-containing sensor histidine kinase, partial [Phycisphaerales bacterium]
ALDAVRDRTGRIVLRGRHVPQRDSVELSVEDNGPGVAAEIRDQIFEPFVSTKGQRGTGLGLAVTRKIAQEHGGAIGVQSEPGKGSVFTIVLPLSQPDLEKGKTHAPRAGVDVLEGRLE